MFPNLKFETKKKEKEKQQEETTHTHTHTHTLHQKYVGICMNRAR